MGIAATAFQQVNAQVVLTIRIRRLAGTAKLHPDCVLPRRSSIRLASGI